MRFIRSICPTLCRKCSDNLFFGSFAKAAKMEKLNVKTSSTAQAARGKSSRCRYSTELVFLKFLQKLTGKHLCWILLLIMLRSYNFIKKELQHICFPVSFTKFLRIPFLRNMSRQEDFILSEIIIPWSKRLLLCGPYSSVYVLFQDCCQC